MINSSYFYNKEALNSSPDFALKYAGAISNTVLHPLCPSLESLYAALAYASVHDCRTENLHERQDIHNVNRRKAENKKVICF